MFIMDQSYMILEENLSTYFNNLVSADTNTNRPIENESHWRKYYSDQGI